MLRRLNLGLLFCAVMATAAPGQEGVPGSPTPADTLLQSARRAGELAAGESGVGGYFSAAFLGGYAAGLLLPVGILAGEPLSYLSGGAGVALVAVTLSRAARPEASPPALDSLPALPPEYHAARDAAYAQHLRRRRLRAGRWGGAVGAGAGLGTVAWLAFLLLSNDF